MPALELHHSTKVNFAQNLSNGRLLFSGVNTVFSVYLNMYVKELYSCFSYLACPPFKYRMTSYIISCCFFSP